MTSQGFLVLRILKLPAFNKLSNSLLATAYNISDASIISIDKYTVCDGRKVTVLINKKILQLVVLYIRSCANAIELMTKLND